MCIVPAAVNDSGDRLGDLDRPGPDREAAANRREPEQVPRPERDGRPVGVDLVPPWSGTTSAAGELLAASTVPPVNGLGLPVAIAFPPVGAYFVLCTLGRSGRPGVTRKWTCQVESS
jgi:hypothetical protein